MERRPRVCKKEKLAVSGKPDRKMPLSTIAKLRGGTWNSSSKFSVFEDGGSTTATSIVLHVSSPWVSSCFIINGKRERERERDIQIRYLFLERGGIWNG